MWLTVLVVAAPVLASAQDWPDRSTLPVPLAPFEGKIGQTYEESEPD